MRGDQEHPRARVYQCFRGTPIEHLDALIDQAVKEAVALVEYSSFRLRPTNMRPHDGVGNVFGSVGEALATAFGTPEPEPEPKPEPESEPKPEPEPELAPLGVKRRVAPVKRVPGATVEIVQALDVLGLATAAELVVATGLSSSVVFDRLTALETQGLVFRASGREQVWSRRREYLTVCAVAAHRAKLKKERYDREHYA